MKAYHIKLPVILITSLLSGCGLVKAVAILPATAIMIPAAVADGVLGTKMADNLGETFDEALLREGHKMDAEAIKSEVTGNTTYSVGYTYFLKQDGTALVKKERGNKVEKGKWTATLGQLCIGERCFDMRIKGSQVLANSINFKPGDTEKLNATWESQVQAEIDKKRAEAEALERKQLTDPMYERAAKLAEALNCEEALELDRLAQGQDGKKHSDNDQSDGYRISFSGCQTAVVEAKCMATPKCRAKKEQEERQREAERQREREYERAHQCDHIYAGRTFDAPGGVFQIVQTYQVIGFSSTTGKVTIRRPSGDTQETTCDAIPK